MSLDENMQIYLVGGALRDELLGLEVTDKDWLVVGATPEQLVKQGFKPIGKDFPVFLHPTTNEEYALARTERKTGKGYGGFIFNASPEVSLEEDLLRRDLTINALARDKEGNLYDPYGGLADLKNKVLRQVSPAFSEDPLRVLRSCRFAASWHYLGFTIHPDTWQLMQQLTATDELNHLAKPRIWLEVTKALASPNPEVFFQLLLDLGATKKLWPNLHQQLIANLAALALLNKAASKKLPLEVIYASLGLQPTNSKEVNNLSQTLAEELLPPKVFTQQLAKFVSLQSQQLLADFSPENLLIAFNQLDAWRKPKEFLFSLQLAKIADLFNDTFNNPVKTAETALIQAKEINAQPLVKAGFKDIELRTELDKLRLEVIRKTNLMHSSRT